MSFCTGGQIHFEQQFCVPHESDHDFQNIFLKQKKDNYILRANKENEALQKIIGWSMIRDKKLLIDISIHMQVRLYKYISISTNKYLCPSKDTLALSLSM